MDATKANEKLGRTPKISSLDLAQEMMRKDLKMAERVKLISSRAVVATLAITRMNYKIHDSQ